ncbi:pyrroline-5-carboxylate reductase [bacterium]|nr:pyrroline-5-carboxylate reductase [bacterium]
MKRLHHVQIGFIGAGNMAEALARGITAATLVSPSRIMMSDVRKDRLAQLADSLGVVPKENNQAIVEECDIVLLAVKPQDQRRVLTEIAPFTRSEHLFISIIAGTRTETIENEIRNDLNPKPRVVRTMPNTPALIQAGATAVSPGEHATDEDVLLTQALFASVGVTAVVEPDLMDAITGLTGSGPAYVFYLIEILYKAGRKLGIPEEDAHRLVLQMVYGSALMAKQHRLTPEELRRQVTSPNGTTQAGMEVLEEGKFLETMVAAIEAATNRSKELGQG